MFREFFEEKLFDKKEWRFNSVAKDSEYYIIALPDNWLVIQHSSVMSFNAWNPWEAIVKIAYSYKWQYLYTRNAIFLYSPPLVQIGKFYEEAIKQNISYPTISLKNSHKRKWLLIAYCQWYNVVALWMSELDLFWIFYNTRRGKCMFITGAWSIW